ncbi:pyridoxamine 5'-phosphate oxidase family protein [Desulforegula conservatrix]|uniref:pyridoxamine 5'-phosphate oxidase family protein n=1 Tax=Desulforegula conservatrix TaxID=153026 RepID=UPI0004048FB7|nr:pyridoxamine 5'-phosphate oxidase family protein [Desulforegula conservatrix]
MTKKQYRLEDIIKDAEDFAEKCHIMTLATACGNDPWAAPVYYIYYNNGFWFFSSENSRHIIDAEKNSGVAAASVCGNPYDWSEIKGLQMKGKIRQTGITVESGIAYAKYIKNFVFVEKMLSGKQVKDVSDLEALFRVRWYVFVPDEVYYSDNSVSFGFRERVK